MSRPIGVFDSGFGGLTVASVLAEQFPDESIYYLGDTKRCPYGERTQDQVKHFSFEIASWLKNHDVKMIIIACNTATAASLPMLKEALPIPVIGVIEAGARGSVAASRSGKIGVLATRGTVESQSYVKAIHQVDPSCEVIQQAAGSFVRIVEDALMNASGDDIFEQLDVPEVHAEVRRVVSGLVDAGVDAICLGCTHFPLLAPIIASEIPSDIVLVNPAYGVAEEVAQILAEDPSAEDVAYRFATTTDDVQHFSEAIAALFPKEAQSIEHVSLEVLDSLDYPEA